MTIIYPTEVTHIHFEGGRPVNPQDATQATASVTPHPLLPAPTPAPPTAGPAPADEPLPSGGGGAGAGGFLVDF